MRSQLDQQVNKLEEMAEDWRSMDRRLTCLEHCARQPRLAMEADGPTNTKTRERTEGAATAVQAMHGDSCSADRVDPDPMCSTSFGDDCTGPPAPPCSGEKSPILGDALTNSRWWLTSHRRSLFSGDDHL